MLSPAAFVVLALPFAAAAPNYARQAAGSCETTFPSTFTLAAINVTIPNSNSTGQPIVFGTGGAIPGTELFQLATWFSTQQGSSQPKFSLTDGELTNTPSVVNTGVSNGSSVQFISTTPTPTPSPIWCAFFGTSGPAVLSVDNSTENFSLCQAKADKQVNIVYNITAANPANFDLDSCFPVRLHMITQ